MDLNDYQQAARRTAIYAAHHRVLYPALGLASEAGEVAGKIKKVLRDQNGDFARAPIEAIKDELVAATNLSKLASRKERGQLSGGGDRR